LHINKSTIINVSSIGSFPCLCTVEGRFEFFFVYSLSCLDFLKVEILPDNSKLFAAWHLYVSKSNPLCFHAPRRM
jgi:hypothetical protein